MCVPNWKIAAFSVCEILRGSKISKLGHVALSGPRPLRGQFVVHGQELPTAYVHAKFEDRSFTRLRNIEEVPKFRKWVKYPRRRPLRGQIVVHGQELPTAHVRAKFEDRRYKNIDIKDIKILVG